MNRIDTKLECFASNYLCTFLKKATILGKMGMGRKSDMEMTFNICNEIEEI